MSENPISTTYPTICRLLSKSPLEKDIAWALDLRKGQNGLDDLKLAFDDRMFHLNDLMLALSCGTILPYDDPLGPELEGNLATLITTVGFEKVRSAYRKKLLVNLKDKFEDVRYEIAVAARACSLLDPGSVELEVKIPDTENDSDVRGKYKDVPVRLEVNVLHDSLPPAVDSRVEEIVTGARGPSGFIVAVNRLVGSEQEARRVRALIELLQERHAATGGADEMLDGLTFRWRRGSYRCEQADSPIRSVEFDLDPDVRLIEHPVFSRSMTPQYMIDDFEQPEGVVTLADVPPDPATHQKNPLSSTIHKKDAEKLKQCEDGVVNIVVLGKPLPMSDNAVDDALYGVLGVYVPFTKGTRGGRRSGKTETARDPKAPFVPAAHCPDPVQFVDPFRKLSAVWLLRLRSAYGLSKCLPNPNARNSVPLGLAEAITDARFKRPPSPDQSPSPTPTAPASEEVEAPPNREPEDKAIFRVELADEFVGVCDSVQRAQQVLSELERSGATLLEMEERVRKAFDPPTDPKEGVKFVSPSDEEVGMHFVVGCGGLAQARACLDEWVRARQVDAGPP